MVHAWLALVRAYVLRVHGALEAVQDGSRITCWIKRTCYNGATIHLLAVLFPARPALAQWP